MKILRVIAGVDPAQGGPTEGMRLSALLQREMGVETEVLSVDEPDSPHVAAFPLKVHAMGRMIKPYGYTPRLARWIALHARDYDAAVVHGLWNHAVVGGGRALIRAGLPYVAFTHGMMDPWFRTTYPRKHFAKQLLWWGLQGRVLNRAQRVLFTSEEEMRLAEGVFRGASYHGEVIAYGAAVPLASDCTDGESLFRSLCPRLGASPYLLFLSRIHAKKGADILLEAFARSGALRPELHLVIAGPDEVGLTKSLLARALELGISDRVHFPGMVTGAAKWGAYLGAEAFALPSHQENFGIAVAEALGCGIPVLTTNKVNIWREIEAARAGLIGRDELADFTRVLQDWIALPDERKSEMRVAAKDCHTKQFSVATAARALKAVLEDIRS